MLDTATRQRLEMNGYSWAQSSDVCYRNTNWTNEEAAAFRKGFRDAKTLKGEAVCSHCGSTKCPGRLGSPNYSNEDFDRCQAWNRS